MIKEKEPSLPFWIDLPQNIPGWEHFVGAWLIPGPPTIVVDVGPKASVGILIDKLLQMGVTRVDYVLLTHIHIDHAGGLGPFLIQFPHAQAVVPAKGLNHLVEPSRLWEGSLKTLGDKAIAYGPIDPAPADRLVVHDAFSLSDLTILETPGHAPFHLSFAYKDFLFCGESAGVFASFGDQIYLRPPTPPRFFFETTVESVEKMLPLSDRSIFFGHTGSYSSSHTILRLYRDQLQRWREIISALMREDPEDLVSRALSVLLEKDPLLACFREMDSRSQERERYFMTNSIAGFAGYLENLS
ncbi:MAG: MBL fold metallo-hydrolase [Thermodesulfobacteriota bacterium]